MMNQEDIFRKVGQILNELQDQYEFLARNPKQLNELELELFLANANFLSDHVQIVRKINSNKALKAIPEHTETHVEVLKEEVQPKVAAEEVKITVPEPVVIPAVTKEEEPLVPEAEVIAEETEETQEPLKFEFVFAEPAATDQFDFEKKSIDNIFDRPLSKEEEEIIAQKQKLRENIQNQQEEELKAEAKPEAEPEPIPLLVPDKVEEKIVLPVAPSPELDKVEEKTVAVNPVKPTINDLLAGKSSHVPSLNEERNKPVIVDLKQAINLNEKLLYIKDLFNGYNLAYAEAIELINKMPDFKTADTFLKNNYAEKNNWAAKQSTVDQFYELLNQRFPKV
jgi:hypothetical protein